MDTRYNRLAEAVLTCTSNMYPLSTIYYLSKNKKNIQTFSNKNFPFLQIKKSILHGHVFIMICAVHRENSKLVGLFVVEFQSVCFSRGGTIISCKFVPDIIN